MVIRDGGIKVSSMLDWCTIPHYKYLKYYVSGCVDWFCWEGSYQYMNTHFYVFGGKLF